MGEIADMILDGMLCEDCGEGMGDDVGFPRLCDGCAKEARARGEHLRDTELGGWQRIADPNAPPRKDKVACPECGKKFARVGLSAHQLAKHQPA